jgi:hypothetical protein
VSARPPLSFSHSTLSRSAASGRRLACGIALLFLVATPGRALLRFNDGLDQIHVIGTAALGWSSNIFSSQNGSSDTTYNASLNLEYRRRAGYIGVNAGLGWDFGRFQKFTSENFANPHASLEFTKDFGRSTGSLLLKAAKQSSTDSAANVRTQSKSYDAELGWKYPVNDHYTFSGTFARTQLDYINNVALVGLVSYLVSLDVFRAYSEERDYFGGYRIRLSDSTAGSSSVDHNFSLGVSGLVIPKVSGSLRLGYQLRQSRASGTAATSTFHGLSAASTVSYAPNRKLVFTGQLSKDFSTTSTDISTDTIAANLNASYAYNAKFSVFADVGGGMNRFLGALGAGRRDYYFTWGFGANWTQSDRFKASLSYDWFHNWSNVARADFTRQGLSLTLTSRW